MKTGCLKEEEEEEEVEDYILIRIDLNSSSSYAKKSLDHLARPSCATRCHVGAIVVLACRVSCCTLKCVNVNVPPTRTWDLFFKDKQRRKNKKKCLNKSFE